MPWWVAHYPIPITGLLDAPPYEQLVEELMRQVLLVKVCREKSRDMIGYFRVVVTLRERATALDLFYNGASGYRAQYYQAAELGTLANRFALDRLLPAVTAAIAHTNKRTCPPAWVKRSLCDPEAQAGAPPRCLGSLCQEVRPKSSC
jgi:hypothetical protein